VTGGLVVDQFFRTSTCSWRARLAWLWSSPLARLDSSLTTMVFFFCALRRRNVSWNCSHSNKSQHATSEGSVQRSDPASKRATFCLFSPPSDNYRSSQTKWTPQALAARLRVPKHRVQKLVEISYSPIHTGYRIAQNVVCFGIKCRKVWKFPIAQLHSQSRVSTIAWWFRCRHVIWEVL
jgi:hypothetical protein